MKKVLFLLASLSSISLLASEVLPLESGHYIANDQDSPIQAITIRINEKGTSTYYLSNHNGCDDRDDKRLGIGGKSEETSAEEITIFNISTSLSMKKTCEKEINISQDDSSVLRMAVIDMMNWSNEDDRHFLFTKVPKKKYLSRITAELSNNDLPAYSVYKDTSESDNFDQEQITKHLTDLCQGHFLSDCSNLPEGLKLELESGNSFREYRVIKK